MQGLSLVVASGGHSSSRCAGLSLSWPLLLRSTGSRCAGSVVVAHGPCCSTACGIFPDQGSNPCPLHWQADSQPLRHQGSPDSQHFDPGKNGRENIGQWFFNFLFPHALDRFPSATIAHLSVIINQGGLWQVSTGEKERRHCIKPPKGISSSKPKYVIHMYSAGSFLASSFFK